VVVRLVAGGESADELGSSMVGASGGEGAVFNRLVVDADAYRVPREDTREPVGGDPGLGFALGVKHRSGERRFVADEDPDVLGRESHGAMVPEAWGVERFFWVWARSSRAVRG
jgi:hypothetical protein